MDFPVDFTQKVKLPAEGGGTGYPYRISAEDLMKNFHFAALDTEEGWIAPSSDSLFQKRKLKLPKLPKQKKLFVLGCYGGESPILEWIETESCDTPTE